MRNPEQTKTLIISKAISIFNKKGYRATSLSDITKATGMTKGAIYGNFDNKDAVAVASFQYATEKILGGLRVQIKAAPTAPLKLKAILSYYDQYIDNPPIEGGCPVINTSVEADDEHPLLRMKVVAMITMIKDSLKQIIHRGIMEGQIRKEIDVDLYANMFYSTIKGAILISRVEGNSRTYDSIRQGLSNQIDAITI
ncbi:MAG: TetR family transcriptional regulator [Flammeovirgaceae bacterium]|nr:TetR family transcriptional regulator [Flammeovirgaceae bacterium]MBR09001.1 TetR family transcriptional regulator [Rickettsiales bacterium]HCX23358.1 TetR/AcrR family transcriptional regulator [Cytophagales bacterium]|tara:strand:+ start:12881 stop:13471 length:591 start_codon:yes stop_codon:yes gene_type:complete